MKTLREYVITPGRPAASRPLSRVLLAYSSRVVRSASRACSSTVASSASSALPSRARARARRMAAGVTGEALLETLIPALYVPPSGSARPGAALRLEAAVIADGHPGTAARLAAA